ncbi:ABC transporter ATP-binding protein [Planomonospora venezuelensis]|uniref:ATP-binding cassette subfamily B protein n=1 Tax=Planomonospora venezuelensis TaxID=1999 RepID=A0A841D1T8_PLAVE|nr:ABC transporter ATP-binding protein [Planomonospora venezuelensis]MBB5962368.1 ATP-binding cassette subfamily B protein [Planomonospora venezuelensis]GIN00749.1 multidrug ABC transporter permease [Planomonospora venezuelensis]
MIDASSPRATPAGARRAVALAWRSAPGWLLCHALLTLAGAATPVAAAWLTKLLLDALAARADVALPLLGLAAAGLAAAATPQLLSYSRAELNRAARLRATEELYTAVNGFTGLSRFEDPRLLDRLRLAEQAALTAPNQVVESGLDAARNLLTFCGFLASLAALSPVMAAILTASAVPALLAELALSRRRARMLWRISPAERRELFYGGLLSTAEAAKEIRLFGVGEFLRGRMLAERRATDAAKRAVDRHTLLVQGGLAVLGGAVAMGGLFWAASGGRLTVGDVVLFVAAVAGSQGAMGGLVGELAQTHEALLMMDHFVAVASAGPDLPEPARPRPLPPLRDGIELRDVWFRYADDQPWVLRGVSLRIGCGRSVALVGLNGAGKSTLVKLLCRLYDPVRGTILWDGVDIREVPVQELRRRISPVFQDYMCYDLTAAENITISDLHAAPGVVEAAARRAGVHDVLAGLPHGYDTLLSRTFYSEADHEVPETGVLLSGGQWQRVALARALLRGERDLMILDEPSSGLDPRAEHEIHTMLREHRAGRTSLLISHRLGTVRGSDLIVVLEDGRVSEEGGHEELMAAGRGYARLFDLQSEGYRTGTATPGWS